MKWAIFALFEVKVRQSLDEVNSLYDQYGIDW